MLRKCYRFVLDILMIIIISIALLKVVCPDFRQLSMVDDNICQWLPIMETALNDFFAFGHMPFYDFYNFKGIEIFDVGYYGLYNPIIWGAYQLGKIANLSTIPMYIIVCFILGNVCCFWILNKHMNLPYIKSLLGVLGYSCTAVFFYMSYWYYIWGNYWIIPGLLLSIFLWEKKGNNILFRVARGGCSSLFLILSTLSGNIQYTVFTYAIFAGIILILILSGKKDYLKFFFINFSCALLFSLPFLYNLKIASERTKSFNSVNSAFFDNAIHPFRYFLFSVIPDEYIKLDDSMSNFFHFQSQYCYSTNLIYQGCLILGFIGFIIIGYKTRKNLLKDNIMRIGMASLAVWIFCLFFLAGQGFGLADIMYKIPMVNSFRYLYKIMLVMPGLLIIPLGITLDRISGEKHISFIFYILFFACWMQGLLRIKECLWCGSNWNSNYYEYLNDVIGETEKMNYRVLILTDENTYLETHDFLLPVSNRNVFAEVFTVGGYDLAYGQELEGSVGILYADDLTSLSLANCCSINKLLSCIEENQELQKKFIETLQKNSIKYLLCKEEISNEGINKLTDIISDNGKVLKNEEAGVIIIELDNILSICRNSNNEEVSINDVSLDKISISVSSDDEEVICSFRYNNHISAKFIGREEWNCKVNKDSNGDICIQLPSDEKGTLIIEYKSILDSICIYIVFFICIMSCSIFAVNCIASFRESHTVEDRDI